ncbi:hypothetical protein [Peterkaempfera sp. SMS 1(5)a]|uniref:hypothetical protein n=1 Tax=Peterkaempfera podocarpi TaxID=3232308 RepID=UPI00366C61CC
MRHTRLSTTAIATAAAIALAAGPAAAHTTQPRTSSAAARLAREILNTKGISYATAHVEHQDAASLPRQNLLDTANGRPAKTSPWGHAHGARVGLDPRMLNGVLKLRNQYHYTFTISEFVGGRHSPNSAHYKGRVVDVNYINGKHVGKRTGAPYRAFMAACRNLGANLVLGPGDANHDTHVHCQWPTHH